MNKQAIANSLFKVGNSNKKVWYNFHMPPKVKQATKIAEAK
jgi:hypothetical protein